MQVVLTYKEESRVFEIQEGANLIGRWDPEASSFPEIDLEEFDPEAKISRKHAMITRRGDQLSLEDLGSLNGTFVLEASSGTESRLGEGKKHPLRNGDQFVVGKLLFKVEA